MSSDYVETHALIALSGKPVHRGHVELIEYAARGCDEVTCFVSTSDRVRPDEFPVSGLVMHAVWVKYIEPWLPASVDVVYGGSPVGKVWEVLGNVDKAQQEGTVYIVHGDPEDNAANFPKSSLEKYVPWLLENGWVRTWDVARTRTTEISGTQMREWLQRGEFKMFAAFLPPFVPARELWDELQDAAKTMKRVKKRK